MSQLYKYLLFALVILSVILLVVFVLKNRLTEGFESKDPDDSSENSRLSPDTVQTDPAHILKDVINITRPFNEIGTLTQQQCYEQDGHIIPQKVSNYNQRTNNYVHTYPDSCNSPFKELVGSFYEPRQGAIGSPVPKGYTMPVSTTCAQ